MEINHFIQKINMTIKCTVKMCVIPNSNFCTSTDKIKISNNKIHITFFKFESFPFHFVQVQTLSIYYALFTNS